MSGVASAASKSSCVRSSIDPRRTNQLQKIRELDLSKIVEQLCLRPEDFGMGWSDKVAKQWVMWYRRFLELQVRYGKDVVPPRAVEQVWRRHVINIGDYERDCRIIFGGFLYYVPPNGRNREARNEAIQKTIALCQKHFGEVPPELSPDAL
jgi:hypothetical protein